MRYSKDKWKRIGIFRKALLARLRERGHSIKQFAVRKGANPRHDFILNGQTVIVGFEDYSHYGRMVAILQVTGHNKLHRAIEYKAKWFNFDRVVAYLESAREIAEPRKKGSATYTVTRTQTLVTEFAVQATSAFDAEHKACVGDARETERTYGEATYSARARRRTSVAS